MKLCIVISQIRWEIIFTGLSVSAITCHYFHVDYEYSSSKFHHHNNNVLFTLFDAFM